MRRLVFAHRERRECGGHAYWVAQFAEDIGAPVCKYGDCDVHGAHCHLWEVSDLTAAELLALDDFIEAFEDLHHFDPVTYCDIDAARLELLRERDEDEGKAADDRGRRVA